MAVLFYMAKYIYEITTFIPIISLVCLFDLSQHHPVPVPMATIPTNNVVLICSTETLSQLPPSPQIPRTQTQGPPAFRKARLTLIGCTDPFLWIWIKVRQATHAKLCQAGPHAHTSSHRVTKRWEEEEEKEGRKEWWKGWRAEIKSESVDRHSGQGEMREDRRLGKKKRCERGR